MVGFSFNLRQSMSIARKVKMLFPWVLLLVFLVPVLSSFQDNEVTQYNDRPIVGILSQELPYHSRPEWKKYKSLIPASYVKFVETAGARAVPLWINRTRSYYENIMGQINGVLFPGGSSDLNAKNGYADAGSMIYDIAQTFNKQGHYFPLWGTCQGFELLAYLGANRTNPLTNCKSDINLNLEFLQDYKASRLYQSASKEVIKILMTKEVTVNFHKYCLTQENVTRYMGDINWRLITLSKGLNGLKFVSSMESRSFPAYGVQFHPEKSVFEWYPQLNISHGFDAVKVAQYFANFFVNEARKSLHTFSSEDEANKALIYNYQPEFTAIDNNSYSEQIYFFEW